MPKTEEFTTKPLYREFMELFMEPLVKENDPLFDVYREDAREEHGLSDDEIDEIYERAKRDWQATFRRPAKKRSTRKGRTLGVLRDPAPMDELEVVTAKLVKVRAKEQRLRERQIDLMFKAHNAGWSLRQIGERANISNPRVHATLVRYANG